MTQKLKLNNRERRKQNEATGVLFVVEILCQPSLLILLYEN